MTTLQEFIEKNYHQENAKQIDISVQLEKKPETKHLFDELSEIEGGRLDLSAYNHLELLRINSGHLKSSLTELVLGNNPKLRVLLLAKSPELAKLDLSGCSQLESHKIKISGYPDLFTASLTIELRLPGEDANESESEVIAQKETQAQVVEVPPKSKCSIL